MRAGRSPRGLPSSVGIASPARHGIDEAMPSMLVLRADRIVIGLHCAIDVSQSLGCHSDFVIPPPRDA